MEHSYPNQERIVTRNRTKTTKPTNRTCLRCSLLRRKPSTKASYMKRNQILAVSLTIMAAAVTVQSAFSAQTSPSGPDVRVVNTQTNPVPVSVINFPAGTNTVNVSSSTNAPLLVRDVDNPARQPVVRLADDVNLIVGESQAFKQMYTVPAGKRLVIEFVSVRTFVGPGQNLFVSVGVSDGQNFYDINLAPTLVGTFTVGTGGNQGDRSAISQQTRFYANAGETVRAFAQKNDDLGAGQATITVMGYLVDVP